MWRNSTNITHCFVSEFGEKPASPKLRAAWQAAEERITKRRQVRGMDRRTREYKAFRIAEREEYAEHKAAWERGE
jgi:hypothetical protein